MTPKLEAVQSALKSYFERFPRISIKALSVRTGVPYATLRRLMQNEVNEIRDETIFKLIDRVMGRPERLAFLCAHYPALARILQGDPERDGERDSMERHLLTQMGGRIRHRISIDESALSALLFAIRDFERRIRDLENESAGPITFHCDFSVTSEAVPASMGITS